MYVSNILKQILRNQIKTNRQIVLLPVKTGMIITVTRREPNLLVLKGEIAIYNTNLLQAL